MSVSIASRVVPAISDTITRSSCASLLIRDDFPTNCIFNKVKTGCGATTIALTNNENYIIAVPTTELIENKCYPIKGTDGNVKFWKKHERKAGLSPVINNLFGLYGNFTLELKKKLKDYLSSVGVKKIICTYDKIDKLMEFINPKDFKLTIDEYHNFLKQYSFRDNGKSTQSSPLNSQ